MKFSTLIRLIKEDYSRLDSYKINFLFIYFKSFFSPSLKAVFLFRLSNYFFINGVKILSKFYYLKNLRWFGVDIHPSTSIKGGLFLPHPNSIVISGWSKIGSNVTIFQQTTIGVKNLNSKLAPKINPYTIIFAGAKLFGDIRIGNNCVVGSNSVVLKSFKKNSVIFGLPGRFLKTNDER